MTDKQQKMYADYKRGWLVGSAGKSKLDLMGTPEPEYLILFEKGFESGREAFVAAMSAALLLVETEHADG